MKILTRDKPNQEIEAPMKYLIVGLGNVGPEYVGTRHNIGFEVVDTFVQHHGGQTKLERYGAHTQIKYKGRTVHVLKPNTFMNLSGKAVKYWLEKEKIKIENLLVIVDDIHLDIGMIRLRAKGAAGGHNGLQDIQDRLGTTKYPRLKIGIGKDFGKGRQVDYVLGKWNETELNQLPKIFDTSRSCVEAFIFRGIQNTMNQYNGK